MIYFHSLRIDLLFCVYVSSCLCVVLEFRHFGKRKKTHTNFRGKSNVQMHSMNVYNVHKYMHIVSVYECFVMSLVLPKEKTNDTPNLDKRRTLVSCCTPNRKIECTGFPTVSSYSYDLLVHSCTRTHSDKQTSVCVCVCIVSLKLRAHSAVTTENREWERKNVELMAKSRFFGQKQNAKICTQKTFFQTMSMSFGGDTSKRDRVNGKL